MSRRDPLWRRSRSRDHQFRLFFYNGKLVSESKDVEDTVAMQIETGPLLSKSTSAASSVPLTVGAGWIGKTTSGSGLRTNLR